MLEELWVIVNSLLGNGAHDGLLTVRLFGTFGCLCFLLSAKANEFDKVVDEKKSITPKALAFIAPAILLIIYAAYAFSPLNTMNAPSKAIGLLSISPALPASYFSMKHLTLPKDEMGFLEATRKIDILALIFYTANYAYPLISLHISEKIMSGFDLLLAVMLFGIIVLCRKGADKWEALI